MKVILKVFEHNVLSQNWASATTVYNDFLDFE